VLRTRASAVSPDEIGSKGIQRLIDDLVETMRAAGGAGLAAPQVDVPLRVFVAEVKDNPRYPYKPPIPLHVVINPTIEPRGPDVFRSYEGCLSVPDLRGIVLRHADIELSYLDRDGAPRRERVWGMSAGTFQHELDHLDGVLFLDRVDDPTTFATWEEFRRHKEEPWLEEVEPMLTDAGIEPL
jgi:peptide deformylase